MRHAVVVVLFAGLSLAACKGENAAGDQMGLTNWQKAPPLLAGVDEGATEGPAGEPAGPAGGMEGRPGGAAPVPAAAPGTVPVRKAGLWQTSVNTGRGGAQSGQLCVDDQSELRRGVFSQTGGGGGGGRGGQGCEPKIAKSGDNWTYSMSCTRQMGDATLKMSSSQTLSGDLNSKYQVKGTSSTSGGPNPEMNGTRQISASGSYVGACPAGMKAGDFKGADGQIRNIMQGGGGGGARGGFGPGGPGGGREGGQRGPGGGGQRGEGGGGRPQQAPEG